MIKQISKFPTAQFGQKTQINLNCSAIIAVMDMQNKFAAKQRILPSRLCHQLFADATESVRKSSAGMKRGVVGVEEFGVVAKSAAKGSIVVE